MTLAAYQFGGGVWRDWNAALLSALKDDQRQDGPAQGSWDPIGPWCKEGGRIDATALMTLSLEVS